MTVISYIAISPIWYSSTGFYQSDHQPVCGPAQIGWPDLVQYNYIIIIFFSFNFNPTLGLALCIVTLTSSPIATPMSACRPLLATTHAPVANS